MASMEKVKESVKESLMGTEVEAQLSAQARATFEKHARRDGESGELAMGPEEFINAIAPEEEDYVSLHTCTVEESLAVHG